MDKKEVTYRCSSGEIETFAESSIWYDIRDELILWSEMLRDMLESDEMTEAKTNKVRGNLEAIRNMLVLPNVMLGNTESLITKINKKEEKDE